MTSHTDSGALHEKARESLASAESDFVAGRYNSCVNRAYFACHQAAKGALFGAGITANGHRAVQAQFATQLISRRKVYPADLRDTLSKLMVVRHRADYSTDLMGIGEARRTLRESQAFVTRVMGREV
jgi:uncharacterized protein (UPF0332 family)